MKCHRRNWNIGPCSVFDLPNPILRMGERPIRMNGKTYHPWARTTANSKKHYSDMKVKSFNFTFIHESRKIEAACNSFKALHFLNLPMYRVVVSREKKTRCTLYTTSTEKSKSSSGIPSAQANNTSHKPSQRHWKNKLAERKRSLKCNYIQPVSILTFWVYSHNKVDLSYTKKQVTHHL